MVRQISLIFSVSLLFFACALLTSCDSGDDDNGYDRGPLLTNFADNLIIPSYAELKTKTAQLSTAVEGFTGAVTADNLAALQDAWHQAYLSWQYSNAYNFGPAGELGLKKSLVQEIGTWPASSTKIEGAVAAGTWDLEDFNRDARGFLAIEYLIFNVTNDNAAILEQFAAANRKQYLLDLVNDIKADVDGVYSAWVSGYREEFIENDGTDVGSSVSGLYNEFVRSYESIKNYKVGIPAGQRPGQVETEPELLEAYYSGQSVAMIKAHMDAIEDIWYGRNRSGDDGEGFREYLDASEGGPALITSTETHITAIHAELDPLSDIPRMSEQLVTDPTEFAQLHTVLQQGLHYFKGDMASILGIAITYSSGDGD
jgi:uncharacterized protein